MYATGKGIDAKQKIATNAKKTKMVIFEDTYDLQDESDCYKGYVDDVKIGRKDNKNRCKDNHTSYNDDDTSYKDVGSCKDDDTSYKDVGSCKDDYPSYNDKDSYKHDSASCRNIIMKSPMWPIQKQAKTDDNDEGRNLIGNNNDDIVEVIDLCSYDGSEDDNGNQYDRID